jgi:uncharacterized protein (DUF885 family)
MVFRTALAALLTTSLLAGAAAAQIAPASPPAVQPAAETAHDRLFRLFKQSDEDNLRRNPISGLFRGDLRYADQFGDYITDEYYAKEKAATVAELSALHSIPRDQLNPTDQIAYDVFEYSNQQGLEGYEPKYFDVTVVRPINHFSGFHTFYPTFASGKGAAPFKTVVDYENNIKRHAGYAQLMDRSIGRFRQGMKSGVFETKLTIRNVIDQLNEQLKQKPEDSQLYAPVKKFPESISAADQSRLTAATRAAIVDQIYPAMTRLRDFLQNEYLPMARDQVGLSSMKGGAVLYDKMVPGLDDPAADGRRGPRNRAQGSRAHHQGNGQGEGGSGVQGNPSPVLRVSAYRSQVQDADPRGADPGLLRHRQEGRCQAAGLFLDHPEGEARDRPYDPVIEKLQAGGSYEQGTPDGSRPGVFYFNAYDLPSRTTPGMTTLYLHEGSPGHHFQISLAQENEALPPFMRFGGNTAYVEGWALYAETLGYPMGFYKDPYQRQGTLDDEMLRAMRLVVDTGIHSKNWTREQAIKYMLDNSGLSETEVKNEVERYIAIPTQALAYKIGAMTIQRLRAKAERELGPKFDIKDFHAQVLMTGALPMAILERKIDAWIAAKK